METRNHTTNRKHHNTEEKQEFVKQWRVSGKSKKVFSAEHGLNAYTFASWIKPKTKPAKKTSIVSEFIPISIKQAEQRAAFAEINFANGHHLTIYSIVESGFLKNILR